MLKIICILKILNLSLENCVLIGVLVLAICIEVLLGVWSIYTEMKATKTFFEEETEKRGTIRIE